METTTLREEITRATSRFMDALSKGDAAAVSRFYTSEGQLLPPQHDAITGRENIESFWRSAIESGMKAVDLKAVEVVEQGDTTYEVGRYTIAASSGEQVDHGKYIVIWRREGSEWKLHRDIWNSSVAPKP